MARGSVSFFPTQLFIETLYPHIFFFFTVWTYPFLKGWFSTYSKLLIFILLSLTSLVLFYVLFKAWLQRGLSFPMV